jgi:uncharacterized protein YjdB
MRRYLFTSLAAISVAVAGCDTNSSFDVSAITVRTGVTSGLTITPSRVRLNPGESIQLFSNAPHNQAGDNNIEWGSANPAVAFVTPLGVVTAGEIGTATVFVRLLVDTMQVGTATIQVVPR